MSGDPFWSNVVLAMHMEGANNGTVFTDSKASKVFTGNAGAITSAENIKYGSSALKLSGASGCNLTSTTTPTDYEFGTGDFTIELWAYDNGIYGSVRALLDKTVTYNSSMDFRLIVNASGQLEFSVGPTTATVFTATTRKVPIYAWTYLAVSRVGSFLYLFIDGVLVHTGAASFTVGNVNTTFTVGSYNDGGTGSAWTGYIQDLRITKGTGRYSDNFTPPKQQLDFFAVVDDTRDPYWANTKLLLHGETITDSSSSAKTLTTTGSAATAYTSIYKYGGGCIRFDGSSYVSLAASADFQFGTGDFTIEAWVNLDTISGYNSIFSNNWAAASNDNFVLGVDGGRLSLLYKSSGGITTPSHDGGAIPVSGWHHVALCRQGNVIFLYIDGYGVAYRVGVSAYSFGYSATNYVGATNTTTSRMTGYLDDLRVTKGTSRYPTTPTTFTPVVNVLSSIDAQWSNVYFAEAFNEAHGTTAFTDASGHYTITNSNSVASASNVTAKYGTTSLKFSGAAGGLTLNDKFTWMHDGTTPWTWETWINVSTVPPVVWGLFGNFATNAAGTDPFVQIYLYPSSAQVGVVCVLSGEGVSGAGGYMIVSTAAFNTATWKHIVFEYDGATLRAYLDGVLGMTCTKNGSGGSGTSYTAGTTGTVNAVIGAYSSGSFAFPMPGYLDDMRITKNVARYNVKMFTPPTYAHPEGSSVVSGTVLDVSATPCDRVVHVHSRATGRLLGTATSDPVTGEFSIGSPELCYAVALDSTGNYNSLILDRLNPI